MSIGARRNGVDSKLLVIAIYKTKMIPMNETYFLKLSYQIKESVVSVYNQVQGMAIKKFQFHENC